MVDNDLEDNDIKMYSTDNEEKSAVAEKLIRTLKNKSYKYMTWIFKNVYIDKLDDILNKYNNTYLQLVTTYKNIFARDYVPNWYGEVFVITKVKNTVLWTCVISALKGEEIFETFYEK